MQTNLKDFLWQNFDPSFWETRRVFADKGKGASRGVEGEKEEGDELERDRKSAQDEARKILEKTEKTEGDKITLQGLDQGHLTPKLKREVRAAVHEEGDFEEARKLLNRSKMPDRPDEWEKLLKLPFSVLRTKLNKKQLNKFLEWLGNAPRKTDIETPAADYVEGEIDAEAIRELHPDLRETAKQVTLAARSGKTLAVWRRAEERIGEEMAKGSELAEQQLKTREKMADTPGLRTEQIKTDAQRKMGEMVATIRGVFGDEVASEAAEAGQREIDEFEEAEGREQNLLQKVRAAVYETVKGKLRAKLQEAEGKGFDEYLSRTIPEMREQLASFITELKARIPEIFKGVEARKASPKYFEDLFETSLRLCETYCKLGKDAENEEKILEALTPADKVTEQDKKIISALIRHRQEIEGEVATKKSEYDSTWSRFYHKTHSASLNPDEEEKVRFAIQEAEKIAEEVGIGADAIWETLEARGEMPDPGEYELVKAWARKHKILVPEAERILTTLQPVSEVIFSGRREFMEEALQKFLENPEEKKSLVEYSENNPNSFVHRFIGSKGDLRRTLLRETTQELLKIPPFVLDLYVDDVNGKEIGLDRLKAGLQEANENVETLRKAVGLDTERVDALRKRVSALRAKLGVEGTAKKILGAEAEQKTSNAEEADTTLQRVERLLENVYGLGEDVDADTLVRETSTFDRAELFETLQEVTHRSTEFYKGADLSIISADIERVLTVTERDIDSLEDLPVEEIAKKLTVVRADLNPQTEKIREEQKGKEMQREKKLQQFADWVAKDELPGQDIFQFLDQLEDLDGTQIIKKIPDEDWKYGEKKAVIKIETSGFEIHVRESDWQKMDADILTSLKHEGWHAIDASVKFRLSEKLQRAFKSIPEYSQILKQFQERYRDYSEEDFGKELLAYLMSEQDDPWWDSIRASLDVLPLENFWKEVEEAKAHFAENGAKVGILRRAQTYGRSAPTTSEFLLNPANKQNYNTDFKLQLERIRKDLDSINRSSAEGKEEFIAHVEAELQPLEMKMSGQVTDEEFKEIMQEMGEIKDHYIVPAISEIAEKESASGGYFSELWRNTTFLTISDIGALWNTGKDFIKRRHERKQKLRVGKAGKPLLDGIYRPLANEYDNQREAAELEEVENYGKGLKNKDAWEVMERLKEAANKDELKACLNLLSERGQIDWYDRRIWRAFERFQSTVKFYPSDADDPNALRNKLHRACGLLWDYDYFTEKDRHNNDSWESTRKKFDLEVKMNTPIMDRIAQSMIIERKNGGKVEPQRYEAYLVGMIEYGKSTPENVFWYFMQGLHFGILNMDRINYIDATYLNQFPPIEWFYQKRPKADEVHALAEMFPPTEHGGRPEAFMDWFWTHVMTNKFVKERVQKSVSQARDKWDHDWATTIFANATANSAKTLLNLNHGQPPLNPTAYPNATVGQLAMITTIARYHDELDDKTLRDEVARHLAFTAMYNSLVMGRVKKEGEDYYVLDPYEKGHPPRMSSGLYSKDNPKINTEDIIGRSNKIIAALDKDLFGFMEEKELLTDERAAEIGTRMQRKFGSRVFKQLGGRAPTTAMQLMDNLQEVIEVALEDSSILNNVLAKARQIDEADHETGEKRLNRIDYDRALNWRDYYHETVKKGVTEDRGMFALA